jgi:UDP-N-acetylmuramoyl-tripeptide--D-alanyl-D-alanine ligase
VRTTWLLLGALGLALAYALQMVRWLRVLQREHYEPSSTSRFWRRWSWPSLRSATVSTLHRYRPLTLSYLMWCTVPAALVVAVFAHRPVVFVVDALIYGVACPWGLTPRGRTSPLHWTRRARTVAALGVLVSLVVVALGAPVHEMLLLSAVAVWITPFTLGLAAWALIPYESRLARGFVTQARQRLARVHPTVVAITGSYGKTSTKNHLTDLLGGDGGVVATPKSFNNRAGLSRAINENLAEGTRVFVAEMGTYGPGEIRDLCEWCVPDVAVITAIGPVHLERMKSLDVIEDAKFEITERARVVIVNIDDPLLALWPARLGERRVRTAGSANAAADVRVTPVEGVWHVWIDGVEVATVPAVAGLQATNVACAVAAALEVGAQASEMAHRLTALHPVANRSTVTTARSGVVLIDDTFNANPASARASLDALSGLDVVGRRVVVTPGLVELGVEQGPQNEALGREIAARHAELAIVGRTNAAGLTEGYGRDARYFKVRDDAVAWVRDSLVLGDAVLYLNDLPDHYP